MGKTMKKKLVVAAVSVSVVMGISGCSHTSTNETTANFSVETDEGKKEYKTHLIDSSIVLRRNRVFPGGSDSKESGYNVRDLCSIPGLGRSPGEGNGNSLQYSCLKNPMDRGAWRANPWSHRVGHD